MSPMNLPRSGVLVLGTNAIQSLLPATLTSQVESLLDTHRLADAAELADQQRKKLQALPRVEEDEKEELQYVYQRIGFQYLQETLFEDAGKALFVGDLDPRVLVSYFPELRGTLFTEDDHAHLFAGVAENMPLEASIDEIIRNYSPHLAPNTREAAPTAELRQILRFAAEQMLEVFLRMYRFKLRTGSKGKEKASSVLAVVDTVLAKIYSKSGKTRELHALIKEPNDIILDDVETTFVGSEQYSALCRLYEKQGQTERLLDAWARIADGDWVERDVAANPIDALQSIEALITMKRDRSLTTRWGVWMAQRDPDRGLRLILARDAGRRSTKGSTEEDTALLGEIQDANPAAAVQFLEHLVLLKRSSDPSLHMQLATSCVDQLVSYLQDEAVHRLWRAKASSYASSETSSSFLSYFAGTTPDSEAKRVRLKTVLFLQGSPLYDPAVIRQRLLAADGDSGKGQVLSLEMAIVEGKLGNHQRALSILTHDLHDATSAEAYCAQGGDVVPMKTAHAIGEAYGLQHWAATLGPVAQRTKGAGGMKRQKTVDEGLKKELLKVLLEVYMSAGESNADRTARLLNSQAINIDVLDVITLLPDDWHINSMSSFLTRSFRRTLHAKHEGQIVKNISMSENLEVSEDAWLVVREQGAVVEEAGDSDDDAEVDEDEALDEKVDDDVHIVPSSVGSQPGEKVRWHPNIEQDVSLS